MELTAYERAELLRRARSRTGRAEDARRARVIVMLADGYTWDQVCDRLECSRGFVASWSRRFAEQRLAGLYSRHQGQAARRLTPKLEARILNATRKPPTDGTTHWSTRRLGARLGVSHMMVARVWAKHGLKPHRLDRYMASSDPDFEAKAADIIGLYLNPPQHAAVFCVDEKTAIQALDRTVPVLPLSPGRAERHGFEYRRHGTLSLYAAFNTQTGEVLGKTAERHTSAQFVAFLADLVATQPRDKDIHVIADNLTAHKTPQVRRFLDQHPTVHMHFTPTYSSWLNQVELWFGKIQRHVISRGIFTSVKDLNRKLMRYIKLYNKAPKTVKWKYHDPRRRLGSKSVGTGHYMQVGDLVAVLNVPSDGLFTICRITGDYYFEIVEEFGDFGHVRPVEVLTPNGVLQRSPSGSRGPSPKFSLSVANVEHKGPLRLPEFDPPKRACAGGTNSRLQARVTCRERRLRADHGAAGPHGGPAWDGSSQECAGRRVGAGASVGPGVPVSSVRPPYRRLARARR